jgi:hypothetical protein
MNYDNEYLRELIYLVVDGQATDEEKNILFAELSVNPDLQKEFDDAMLLNKAVTNNLDVVFTTPKKAITENTFRRLGLIYFTTAASISKIYNVRPVIALLLIASLGLSSLFIKSNTSESPNNTSNITNTTLVKSIDSITLESKTETELKSKAKYKNSTIVNSENESNSFVAYTTDESLKSNLLVNKNPVESNQIEILNAKIYNNDYPIKYSVQNDNIANTLELSPKRNNILSVRIEKLGGLALSGIEYLQDGKESSGFSSFGNYVVSGMYEFESGLKLGLSIGNEFMPLYIKSREEFRLRNNLYWIGARAELPLLKVSENLDFVATATIASNQSGPYTRIGLIADYKISDEISIGALCNGSTLLYKNNDSYYFNSMANYGININFKF